MKRISYHVLVLVICLVAVSRTTEGAGDENSTAGTQNVTEVIEEVCGKTKSKQVCMKTLKGDPLVVHARRNMTARDLAISFLRAASQNATAMVYELKTLIEDDRLEPHIQEGLSDCRDMMVDAGDQIEAALTAINTNVSVDSEKWLQIATDATDLCKSSLEGHEQVMLAKANGFYNLCAIASDICHQL